MNDFEKFCKKYNAYVRPGKNRYPRYQFVPKVTENTFHEDFVTSIKTVESVEIEMPEDSFKALVEHEDWLHQFRSRTNNIPYVDQALYIVEQHERECIARRQNAAVKQAYEEYLMLLKLTGY